MQTKEEVKEFIWGVVNTLRNALFIREIEYSAVRLVFIKYAVDNYVGASTVEDMQSCARAQKTFAMRDVENGIETLVPVLRYIDDSYGMNGIVSGVETVNKYSYELFGFDNVAQRKNATIEDYKAVLRFLSSVDLEEISEDKKLGPLLVDALIDVIVSSSYRNMYATEHMTKPQVNKLVSQILNVQSGDKYCDFSAGVGLSTLEIVKDKATSISIADIDLSAIPIAAMLLIMSGYKDLDVRCEDTLRHNIKDFTGNKVFVDAPWGMRIEKTPDNAYSDVVLASINKAANVYLDDSEDAISVVSVPAGALFGTAKAAELKKGLLERGEVKAVIALSALRPGLNVNLNLIVLTKNHNEGVLFINALDSINQNSKKNDNDGSLSLTDELISKIVTTYENMDVIEGFSEIVANSEIEKNNYNLLPTVYISPIIEEDETTLEEINSQLDDLYKQLLKN